MGSQAKQAALWGQRPQDWAQVQEPTGHAGYLHALQLLNLKAGFKLLDVGCGSGMFCELAASAGAFITGIDATSELIAQARLRAPQVSFSVGEMEELPFEDNSFDVVTGFNSFQYAADTRNALTEAKRVLKRGGILIAMIWGEKEDCEAASFLKAVGGLMPPPMPGAAGPFALTENRLLEKVLSQIGLEIIDNTDVTSFWEYPDKETTLKGLISSGPVSNAISFSGMDKVKESVAASIDPYVQSDGRVIYRNKFRVITSKRVN